MIPKRYTVSNSCVTCKHAFVKFNYDDEDQYFCHFDKSPRPLCGSVGMDESYRLDCTSKVTSRLDKLWDTWAEKHAVSVNGICDNYKEGRDE